jgi:glycerol uptake facilitator protein
MIFSQCIGAFIAAALVYWVYIDIEISLNNSSIFATYPRSGVTTGQAMISSIVGTAFMILSINGVAQSKPSQKPDLSLLPIYTGIAVMTYGICFSLNTGYAINPARDIGPRFFIFLVGFPDSFSRGNDVISWYWWIPIISPLIGAIRERLLSSSFKTFSSSKFYL